MNRKDLLLPECQIKSNHHCSYFIVRKQRFCKMRPIPSNKFCSQHSIYDDKLQRNSATERMRCPLDPKHTCLVRRLEKHLKKCNAKEKEKPIYYLQSVNCGMSNKCQEKITIGEISDEELLGIIQKIKNTYFDFVPHIGIEEKHHPVLQDALNDKSNGQIALKHLCQQSSLLGHMLENKLLTDGTHFVEFGAGRGRLTYWITEAVDNKDACKFLLIDRASHRHKSDTKLRSEERLSIERIRIDIEHLCLGRVPFIASHKGAVVGVSKHLCGVASDLALKCMTETLTDMNNPSEQHWLQGIIMAMCCHHQCSWQTYVGRSFLENQHYTERDFQLMCGIASWATCGRMPQYNDNKEKGDNSPALNINETEKNRYQKLNMDATCREEIGFQCKKVLDYGRLSYLQQHNFNSFLVHYVDRSISLENVALIALRKS